MAIFEAGSRVVDTSRGRQERLQRVLKRIQDIHEAVSWTARFVNKQIERERGFSLYLTETIKCLSDAEKIFTQMEEIAIGLKNEGGDENNQLIHFEKTVNAFEKLYTYLKSVEKRFVDAGRLTPNDFAAFILDIHTIQSVILALREDLRILKIEI